MVLLRNTLNEIDGLLHNLALTADVIMDGVQKHHHIDGLQRPLLPLPGNGQDLVDDVSDRVA